MEGGPGTERTLVGGLARLRLHNLQPRCVSRPWLALCFTALHLPVVLGTMVGDIVGHFPSGRQVEAGADRDPPTDRKHCVDDPVHRHMEVLMDELTWELLSEVQGRLEAEFIKSYLESQGIEVELFQESIGHHIYPVTVDGLGRVQIFVPKDQAAEARQLLEEYNQSNQGSNENT